MKEKRMELSPLGENPSPAAPMEKEAPAAVPSVSALPYDTTWTPPQPNAPQAADASLPRKEPTHSSTPTAGAVVCVIISLLAGGLRAYNRYERRQELHNGGQVMQQNNVMQPSQEANAANDAENGARLEADRAENRARAEADRVARLAQAEQTRQYEEQSRMHLSHTSSVPVPPVSTVRMPDGGMVSPGMNTSAVVPLPDAQALLQRDLPNFAHGRSIMRVVSSPLGNHRFSAAVTYSSGDVSQLRFDGSTWTLESDGLNALQAPPPPPPSRETNPASGSSFPGGNGSVPPNNPVNTTGPALPFQGG